MIKMRSVRITLAVLCLIATTTIFLDSTGSIHSWLGWLAKIQFLPALFALNVGVVVGLILVTLIWGRLYCSIICPLGVLQDVVARVNRKRNRYRHSPAVTWLRYGVWGLFVIVTVAGIGSVAALLEPYSTYGRIASNLFAPIYGWGNNILAYFAQRAESYAFYQIDVWIKSVGTLVITLVSLVVIAILAWRGGRTYCNTICPVGTVLGVLSKFSIYKHQIDTQKCNGCGLCARNCKASCIDTKTHTIDYSRCVSCFNCIERCNKSAINYGRHRKNPATLPSENLSVTQEQIDSARRNMLTLSGALLVTSVVKAQQQKMDGGLAFIEDKKIPKRHTPVVPPGAQSIRNFTKRCTGCQLCVSVCPNQLLRPSTVLTTFMQPEVSYERGYCRPECIKCSDVCPTGAIQKITPADKSSTQIGHAVWIEKNCVVLNDDVECGNCARHCPTGAITMVGRSHDNLEAQKIPIVNVERCIGCGACENLCPARPFSAIYVEGHNMHRTI